MLFGRLSLTSAIVVIFLLATASIRVQAAPGALSLAQEIAPNAPQNYPSKAASVTINGSAGVVMYKLRATSNHALCWIAVYPNYGIQQDCLSSLEVDTLKVSEQLKIIGKTVLNTSQGVTTYVIHDEVNPVTCFVTLQIKRGIEQDCFSDLRLGLDTYG